MSRWSRWLISLSAGLPAEQVPEDLRAQRRNVGLIMLAVALLASAGIYGMLSGALAGRSGAQWMAGGIGVTVGICLLLIDRSIVTASHADDARLQRLLSNGLLDALRHEADLERARATAPIVAATGDQKALPPARDAGGEDGAGVDDEADDDEADDDGGDEGENPDVEQLTPEEKRVLGDYTALHATPTGPRTWWPLAGRLFLSVTVSLLAAHGADAWLFGQEIDKQNRPAAVKAYNAALEDVKSNRDAIDVEVSPLEDQRVANRVQWTKTVTDVGARLTAQKRSGTCPASNSASYEHSQCKRRAGLVDTASGDLESSKAAIRDTEPYATRYRENDEAKKKIVDVGVDAYVHDERGVLADLDALWGYLNDNPKALFLYLLVFFAVLGFDLTPVLTKLGMWKGPWEQEHASHEVKRSVARAFDRAADAISAPAYADARVQRTDARQRRDVAEARQAAEQAEHDLRVGRMERERSRVEQRIVQRVHRRQAARLAGSAELAGRALAGIRRRVFDALGALRYRDQRRDDGHTAPEPGEPAGHAGGYGPVDEPEFVKVPDLPEVGEVLSGREMWRIAEKLSVPGRAARGPYTAIYRAVCVSNSTRPQGFLKAYALPQHDDSDPALAALYDRARNEGQRLRSINPLGLHRTLPKWLDHQEQPDEEMGRLWTVTQFYNANNVEQWVVAGGAAFEVSLRVVLSMMTDVLSGLVAARLIHRDIKPQNVLVFTGTERRRPEFMLVDWETAYSATAGEPVVVQLATPGFVPPDPPDLRPIPRLGDDLYSLGATAWYLCTGLKVGEAERLHAGEVATNAPMDTKREQVQDLLTLAIHRTLKREGGYIPLRELLPPEVPENFAMLIDRLLRVPRGARTLRRRAQDPGERIAGEVLEEIATLMSLLENLEEDHGAKLMVGTKHRRKPTTYVARDTEWHSWTWERLIAESAARRRHVDGDYDSVDSSAERADDEGPSGRPSPSQGEEQLRRMADRERDARRRPPSESRRRDRPALPPGDRPADNGDGPVNGSPPPDDLSHKDTPDPQPGKDGPH